MLNEAKIKARA